ncbi:MAG: hypothetical protein WB755_19080 [Terriglobales bacterium]
MKPALIAALAISSFAGTAAAQASPDPQAEAPAQSTQSGPTTPAAEAPARSTQAGPATPAPEAPAQSTAAGSAASASAPASDKLAAGTVVSVELSKSLDARKSKANDRIEARTSMDLLQHGQIVIPRNTKIVGHVTEAKAHSKESPNSTVGIAFDRVLMKNGRELPLQAAVQAIARPLPPALPLASDDSMSPATAGIPSASQQQRPAMTGASPQPPSTYGTQYPGNSGSRSDNSSSPNSTVSPLDPATKGVVGMKGFSLTTSGEASIVSSNSENVHLDSGTQLILRVQ